MLVGWSLCFFSVYGRFSLYVVLLPKCLVMCFITAPAHPHSTLLQPCMLLCFIADTFLRICQALGHKWQNCGPSESRAHWLYQTNNEWSCFIADAFLCIRHALGRKWRSRGSGESRAHWLDWADDRCSLKLIADVKAVLNVFVVFAPL